MINISSLNKIREKSVKKTKQNLLNLEKNDLIMTTSLLSITS